MKFLVILLTLVSSSLSLVPVKDGWRLVKSPLDTPNFQEILSKIYPPASKLQITREGRIAGGELAELGQFPYQTLLYNYNNLGDQYICGGAIITHRYILTAGHCLYEIVRTSIYAGIIDRINGPAVWTMDVLASSGNFIFHEEYQGVKNDIALIHLTSSIPSHPHVDIINLPCRSDDWISLVGKTATISGFGRVNDVYLQPSERLRYITQQIYDNSICEKSYGSANIRDTNLCLSGANGRSTCQGDSGGPLTMEIDPGRKVIVGITSFGAQIGCTLGHPVVFTRVTSYLHWIETKTGIFINDYC